MSTTSADADYIKHLEQKIKDIALGNDQAYGSSAANLYLALEKPAAPRAVVQQILRTMNPYHLFKLKPFGEPLDPMAKGSLYFAAGLMSAIFILEFVGWSLLFNEIMNAGVLKATVWTIPAVFFGLMFAFGIIALEQAILTADTTRGWGRLRQTLLIRIALIFASALITTQPYELLIFSAEVKERVHQESLRAEMVSRYLEFQQLNGAGTGAAAQPGLQSKDDGKCVPPSRPPAIAKPEGQMREVYEAQQQQSQRDWLREGMANCEAAVKTNGESLTSAKAEVGVRSRANADATRALQSSGCQNRQNEPETQSCVTLRNESSRSSRMLQQAVSRQKTVEARGIDLKQYLESYVSRLGMATAQPTQTANAPPDDPDARPTSPELIEKHLHSLRRYLNDLVLSQPGQHPVLHDYLTGATTPFNDFEYGITDKVRVLYSELLGTPYQWPTKDQQLINSIGKDFSLRDKAPGSPWFRWLPWAMVFFASIFLPFASLGYKATLNENLSLYFLTEYQLQMGHVGATVATEAARRFWERRNGVAVASPSNAGDRDSQPLSAEHDFVSRQDFASGEPPPEEGRSGAEGDPTDAAIHWAPGSRVDPHAGTSYEASEDHGANGTGPKPTSADTNGSGGNPRRPPGKYDDISGRQYYGFSDRDPGDDRSGYRPGKPYEQQEPDNPEI